MEAASAAAAAVRGGSLLRARARAAYGCARGPRRVVGAGLAAPGRGRALVAVASLPDPLEPVPSPAQDGVMAHAPQADEEVHEDDTAAAAAETSSPSGAPGKTVRVRFVLKKQCPFGQSFHLVGDDPALGLWDLEKAVALQWAEGHEWIVEKDLPANKLIEFKFLLRDTSGKLQWQNGPNRSLQTGETENTLVVYDDWDEVKNQKIEEGEASIGMEDAVVSDDNESRKDDVVENELQMDDHKEEQQDESIVAEEDEKSAFATNDSDQGESVKANEADPPTQPLPPEELKILSQLHEKEDKENGYTSSADESYAEKTEEENILSEDGAPVENGLTNAYEHDFLWGWKALQQLLMSLGFKMDT